MALGHGGLVSGGRDGIAILWDVASATAVRKLKGHQGHVTSVTSLPGELYATGAQDGHVMIWDARSPSCLHDLSLHVHGGGSGAVVGIEHTASGDVVTAGADQRVQVVDPRASFNNRATFTEHRDFIYSLHVAGNLALTGGGDGLLLVHDVSKGRLLYGLGANQAAVRGIAATRSHLVAAGDDGNAVVYSFEG